MIFINIFNDKSVICVCCKERFSPDKFAKSSKNLGICTECYEKFEPVPLFNPLEGTKNINYFISGYYYNNSMKSLIHRFKFNGEHGLSDLFSAMLYDSIKDIKELYDFDYMTNVPISAKRFKNRGYNQAELIAKPLSELLDIPYVKCIHKHKHTIAQSLLKKSSRITNIKGAFIADYERVKGKRILLLDDIITTGSTMNECANELLAKEASFVAGISLAITRRKIISEALSIWGNDF